MEFYEKVAAIIGVALAAAGSYLWAKMRGRKKESQQKPESVQSSNGPPKSSVSADRMVDAYHAFLNGVRRWEMSFVTLQLLAGERYAVSATELGRKVEAIVESQYSQKGFDSVLNQLSVAGLIQPGPNTRTFECSRTGRILHNDYFAWKWKAPLTSNVEQRLDTFWDIVKFAARTNMFQHVLKALDISEEPMTAIEVHAQAKELGGKDITLKGVEDHLEDLTKAPFVVKDGERYAIHPNGSFVIQCIALLAHAKGSSLLDIKSSGVHIEITAKDYLQSVPQPNRD